MSINRVPILVWGTLTANAANIFAVPAVSLAFFLLWMDRNFGTHFTTSPGEGQPLLWQHLFWMFAHPWVYAIVLPAMGLVSDVLPVFCRRPACRLHLRGARHRDHHDRRLRRLGASHVRHRPAERVAVVLQRRLHPDHDPERGGGVRLDRRRSGRGRPVFRTPFLFFASFIVLFVIGGVSGFMTGVVPVDWQLTDTYFVVAHLHYVLLGINVFPVVGALYFWFPKMTGRMLDERLGKWNFWMMFIGFNIAFFPMHITGLLGMPRRIYTYPDGRGLGHAQHDHHVGSFLLRDRRPASVRERR